MRSRVYKDAQSYSILTRKVIVIFGVSRFQEINKIKTDKYLYITMDLDVTKIAKRLKRMKVIPYDGAANMAKQSVISCMASMRIPGVFSFSLSYHSSVIAILMDSGITVYGCVYIHNNMSREGVGSHPVMMKVEGMGFCSVVVRSIFGKFEWIELVLLFSSNKNFKSIREFMSDLRRNIDSSIYEIMSRAAIIRS